MLRCSMWYLGEIRIGIISFDMLISANNSNTKPNFTEVAEFIAHELEVDNLQVQLSYFGLTWLSLEQQVLNLMGWVYSSWIVTIQINLT